MTDLQLHIARRAVAKVDPEHLASFFRTSTEKAKLDLNDAEAALQRTINGRHWRRRVGRNAAILFLATLVLTAMVHLVAMAILSCSK